MKINSITLQKVLFFDNEMKNNPTTQRKKSVAYTSVCCETTTQFSILMLDPMKCRSKYFFYSKPFLLKTQMNYLCITKLNYPLFNIWIQ